MIHKKFILKTFLAVAVACVSGSLLRANQEFPTSMQEHAANQSIAALIYQKIENKELLSILSELGDNDSTILFEHTRSYLEKHPDKFVKNMKRIFADKQSTDALIEMIDTKRQCALLISDLLVENFELLDSKEYTYYFVTTLALTKDHNSLVFQEIVLELADNILYRLPVDESIKILQHFYLTHEIYGPVLAKRILTDIRLKISLMKPPVFIFGRTDFLLEAVIDKQPFIFIEKLIMEDKCNVLSTILSSDHLNCFEIKTNSIGIIATYVHNNFESMLKHPHGMRVALYFLRYYEFDDLHKLLPHIKYRLHNILQEIDCRCAQRIYKMLMQAGKKHDEFQKISRSFLKKCTKHFFQFKLPLQESSAACSPTLKHILVTGLTALGFTNDTGSALPVLQLANMVIKNEQELNNQGYYTFLHGQRWHYQLIEEWYTKLWSVVHSKNTQNFLFTHVKQLADDQETQTSKRTLITSSGRNATLPDNSDPRELMLFMNAGLFYNSQNLGSNTAHYVFNNDNVNTHIQLTLQDVFKLHSIESIYNTYLYELKLLEQEHAKLSDFGNLLLIAVPEDIINQAVFIAVPGGYKKKVTITDIGETDDVQLILNTLRTNPEKIENFDANEFCLIMTADKQGGLNPESGIKFFQFNTVEPERWSKFKEKEQALFERISQEITAQVNQPENSHL